ncbi:MAG: LysR family transcriptional regulator [Aliishimia sp.]
MNRTDLNGLRTFLAIVEHRTMRAAARELGVNPSAVSQKLKAFEDVLGSAVFVRDTRSVSLTDVGEALYARTHHLLGEVDAALDATRRAALTTSGQLRITLPYRAWQLALAPRMAAFQSKYSDIELNFSIDEELTDIVSGGFHAGIRLGDFLTDDMIAVALTPPLDATYVASPAYLEKNGTPDEPADLLRHDCIRYRQITAQHIAPWHFTVDGAEVEVNVSGRMIFNDLRLVMDAAMRGFGIGWSLRAGIEEQIISGELVEVLHTYTPNRPRFHLYFPKQLKNMSRLRAFIDHFSVGV